MYQLLAKWDNEYKTILAHIVEESEPNILSLINVGSCGLHIVHEAFKYRAMKAEWKIDIVLRSLYNCFNDSPARREDHLIASGEDAELGLKFCSTCWLHSRLSVFCCVQEYILSPL